jgi:hypothetical protein
MRARDTALIGWSGSIEPGSVEPGNDQPGMDQHLGPGFSKGRNPSWIV